MKRSRIRRIRKLKIQESKIKAAALTSHREEIHMSAQETLTQNQTAKEGLQVRQNWRTHKMTVAILPSSNSSDSLLISRMHQFLELNYMKTAVKRSIILTLSTFRRWERKLRLKIACMKSRNSAKNNRDRNIYLTLEEWKREIRVLLLTRTKTLNATRSTCRTLSGKL